jgi:phage I-like protein
MHERMKRQEGQKNAVAQALSIERQPERKLHQVNEVLDNLISKLGDFDKSIVELTVALAEVPNAKADPRVKTLAKLLNERADSIVTQMS